MKIYKVRDVKTPTRGTTKSAGIDFYIPNDFETVILHPQQDVLIPSGIKACVPDNYMLMGADKSGIATKKKLGLGAKIVDSDYLGEIHIHLFNNGHEPVIIESGDKIAQFILVPVSHEPVEEVTDFNMLLKSDVSERGDGGFGSTGVK